MTCEDVIDGILERKKVLNATNQQIADASNVPKTTVDRILRKETPNPSFQTILDIATAVGYDFSQVKEPIVNSVEPTLQQVIYVYEQRCADLERESRLKTVQSNSLLAAKNKTIEDKSRWVKFLTFIAIAFASLLIITWAGIALLLHYDLTHLDIGYFQR